MRTTASIISKRVDLQYRNYTHIRIDAVFRLFPSIHRRVCACVNVTIHFIIALRFPFSLPLSLSSLPRTLCLTRAHPLSTCCHSFIYIHMARAMMARTLDVPVFAPSLSSLSTYLLHHQIVNRIAIVITYTFILTAIFYFFPLQPHAVRKRTKNIIGSNFLN